MAPLSTATSSTASPGTGGLVGNYLETHPGALESGGQRRAHGLGGGDLPGSGRVVVQSQAQRALGQGDAREVVRIHSAHPRVQDGRVRLGDEVDGEGRAAADLVGGTGAGR